MHEAYLRKSRIAYGFCLILLMALGETWVADHRLHNPLSPYLWAVMGVLALACLLYGLWCRSKAQRNQVSKPKSGLSQP